VPARTKGKSYTPTDRIWTQEEDSALLKATRAFGTANWELVADVLASMIPTCRHSAQACFERCSFVLLPYDHDKVGSHCFGPKDICARKRAPFPPGLAHGIVGEHVRNEERLRSATLSPLVQRAEITMHIKQFALFTRMMTNAHAAAKHCLLPVAPDAPPHPSGKKAVSLTALQLLQYSPQWGTFVRRVSRQAQSLPARVILLLPQSAAHIVQTLLPSRRKLCQR
jgi:hypothetical protein